jgi:hypothetical protein
MYAHLSSEPLQVQTLVSRLDEELDLDNDLSQSLLPEVWNVARKAADMQGHAAERRKYLRILVLREVATGPRQRIGLEPWGRMLVDYEGLAVDEPFFKVWGGRLGLSSAELLQGVAAVLDFTRRNRVLLDRDGQIFSRIWQDGDREIANGYLPLFRGGPKGVTCCARFPASRLRISTPDAAASPAPLASNRRSTWPPWRSAANCLTPSARPSLNS